MSQRLHANSASRLRVVGLLTTTALLGACSGQDGERPKSDLGVSVLTHDQYQQHIDQIMSGNDARAATRLFTEAVATSYETTACEERVRGLYERLGAIVDAVEELRPPADAKGAQEDFLEAAQESVRLVGVAADDVGKGALLCGQPLNRRIYGLPSTVKAERAIAELEQRGYRIFGE